MKAIEITEKEIQKSHCDWIKAQTEMLKALLNYDDKTVAMNKMRATSAIDTAMDSLRELKLYIDAL